MDDDGLSTEIKQFLARYIESVAQLETLLLLRNRPEDAYTAEQISKELRIDPAAAADQLSGLSKADLLECTNDPIPRYRFAPHPRELADTITGLARAYADRRVSVISLIYSKPLDKIRIFADAFRFWKDKRDDR